MSKCENCAKLAGELKVCVEMWALTLKEIKTLQSLVLELVQSLEAIQGFVHPKWLSPALPALLDRARAAVK